MQTEIKIKRKKIVLKPTSRKGLTINGSVDALKLIERTCKQRNKHIHRIKKILVITDSKIT